MAKPDGKEKMPTSFITVNTSKLQTLHPTQNNTISL
jgi:hypothetical protein